MHERRVRISGGDAEKFKAGEIYERDGWTCGICDEPVNRDLKWPDPLSVSLDHIVPVSRGGGHTRANTRCSHLICNTRRGAPAAA
jgi:5-methylcytosine-specific restriction endonuclease McrA